MSFTVSNPLSLENQCLLHLICHLEDYLPETLASLPLHLRHRLLRNLPAIDVCQLENTSVSAGIDMEGIWKTLTRKRLYSRPEHLVDYSCGLLLSDNPCHLEDAKAILFSADDCLGMSNWKGIQHSFALIKAEDIFEYPVTYRHVRYSSEECREIEMLSLLVENCQWRPTWLKIEHSQCVRTLCQQCGKYTPLVRKLMSGVQELILYAEENSLTEFFLKQLLVNPQNTLKGLKLRHVGSDSMATVAKLFGPTINSSDPLYSHPNIPYSGLSSIEADYHCNIDPEFDSYLQSVVQYQCALTSVSLQTTHYYHSDFIPTPSVSLVSTLVLLFHQPKFRELGLKRISMSWEHLGVLLPQFLSASSEDNPKVLKLCGVKFPESGIPPEPVEITTGSGHRNRLPKKSLVLTSDPSLISDLSEWSSFLHWLSAYNYTGLLSSISIACEESYPRKMLPVTLLEKPTMTLQHLKLRYLKLHQEPSPDNLSVMNIFQSPHLKSFHLTGCAIGPNGFLPALTQGLQRQLSVGSLEDLSLETNDLDTSPDSELREFFNVIFSLPQLSNLQLNLSYNQFTPHHLSLMHDSWRMNASQSGKQLKSAKLIELQVMWDSNIMSKLQDIAQTAHIV